jgi:replicative DNA helicase
MVRVEELKKETELIANAITNAESLHDWDKVIELKREYHGKKLEMLDEIESEGAVASTISAKDLKREVDSRPKVPRYETGIHALDTALKGGIEIGTFIQLAGESFAGKTHLTLEILSNISSYKEVLFFNFEMGDIRISHRLSRLLKTDAQWNNFRINSKARKLSDIIKEIKTTSRRNVKFFAIDSKMKIEVPEEKDDYRAFNKISKELAKLAQQEEIIIFLINQMNEEDQKNNRMAFKGSGDQMYDSDIALFYMVDKSGDNESQWVRTLVCRKNRQDEINFKVPLKLNYEGRTVGLSDPTNVIAYSGHIPVNEEKIDMAVL